MNPDLHYLYLDLNSYFASVEQQRRPELRGRPVAVVPVEAETGCCIAASYEAKRRGVRTGTRVYEARKLCPDIALVRADHRAYVEFHHRILHAIDACIPVETINSIDEVACRLTMHERYESAAVSLAQRVKQNIMSQVGECLRSSVGLAPNAFLAKVGTELQKPDGLVVIHRHDLPDILFQLDLTDLPGIGPRMHRRLLARGITSIESLWNLSEREMERLWGSVLGCHMWRWLRGDETGWPGHTRRRSIGHQHVLAPEKRSEHHARAIAMRLLHKATSRMRSIAHVASWITLCIRHEDRTRWVRRAFLAEGTDDELTIAHALGRLWDTRPRKRPLFIAVTLDAIAPRHATTSPLFPREQAATRLAATIDRINKHFGRHAIYLASMHCARDSRVGGIAFKTIPDLALPDGVNGPRPTPATQTPEPASLPSVFPARMPPCRDDTHAPHEP